jgi:hypothetical protein
VIDSEIQMNPALAATCLSWLCEGYGKDADDGLSPVWAMLCLALLAPDEVRKTLPGNANAGLAGLFHSRPAWRIAAADAIRDSARPFWAGLRLGVGTGAIRLDGLRLHRGRALQKPSEDFARELCSRAKTLGRIVARERDDAARSALFSVWLDS